MWNIMGGDENLPFLFSKKVDNKLEKDIKTKHIRNLLNFLRRLHYL